VKKPIIAGISCKPSDRNFPTKINKTMRKANLADPTPVKKNEIEFKRDQI
jgi:hypothetical protein